MVFFILFIVFASLALLLGLIAFIVPPVDSEGWRVRRTVRGVAMGSAVIGLVLVFFASWTTVGTKNLGVKTTFGRISGFMDNGFHWKAPWELVTEINDAIITDTYASDGGSQGKQQGGAAGTCVSVRIARQATACVNVSVRWQIREQGLDYLFRNYKNNEAIQDNVMLRDLQQAMNEKFISYDPLGIDEAGNSTNLSLAELSGKVQQQMQAEIGQYIDVQSVIIPLLNFDNDTQQRINQLQQQVALTRVAQQAKLTALAQADANKALAASISNDPNVLVSKCLDILHEVANKGQPLPAGFSCFGAGANVAVGVK